ncbi:hypothetical protein H6F51_10310 [Cyanobacteria bacterium FACHB-DQ100]|nr:hypothetical protein [Cyanobacteria bacterium FACHB-DQ100]
MGSGAWTEAFGCSRTGADRRDVPGYSGLPDHCCRADPPEPAACQSEAPTVWWCYRSECRACDAEGRAAGCCYKCELTSKFGLPHLVAILEFRNAGIAADLNAPILARMGLLQGAAIS